MADEKENSNLDLHAVIFAGPNGSGKTSLIDEIKRTGLATLRGVYPVPAYFINPDQVAKDLQGDFPNQNARDEAAQRAAMRVRAEATASKLPFAFETVMSHPSRINEMLLLKEQGYQLFLTFITTDDPETNVARVKFRYETGTTTGHFVAPEKIRERYHRTLALLPLAAEIADAVYVYDNSVDFEKPTLQVVIERGGQFAVSPDANEWVIEKLVKPLRNREQELAHMIADLEKIGYPLGDTDELRGTYSGNILTTSTYFIAQYNETNKQAVIHDRLMLETANRTADREAALYRTGEDITIRYSPANAPIVERNQA